MIELCSFEKYQENVSKAKDLFPFLEEISRSYGMPLKKEEASFLDDDAEVLVVYGLAPLFYLKAEKWLNSGKTLIFLEDEKEAFSYFLQTSIAEKVLSDKRVKIYFLQNEEFIFKKIAWENVFLKIKITASYFYSTSKKNRFLEIEGKFNEMIFGAFLSFSNLQDFGKLHFQNTFQNLLNLKSIKLISHLKKSFQNVPAVICGAGPSLEKSLPLLEQIKDKALIFAGGTALNILSKNNILPHFSAAIDKEAEDRFKKNNTLETIFLHPLQVSSHNLKAVHGEKILVQNDLLGLESALLETLSVFEENLDTGWTVGTFLISAAHFLGCSPIFFTGLDFCFVNKKYAKGSGVENKKGDALIQTQDVFGNKAFTQKDWILAVKWIEDFALQSKAALINANQGGLKIKNVLEGPLDANLKKIDLSSLLHNRVQAMKKTDLPKEKIIGFLIEIEKSALCCEKLCSELLQKLEKDFNSGSFEEYSLENFEKELFLSRHLLPLWNIYSYVIKRSIDENSPFPLHFLYFLNKLLFFKKVIEDYLTLGPIWKNTK